MKTWAMTLISVATLMIAETDVSAFSPGQLNYLKTIDKSILVCYNKAIKSKRSTKKMSFTRDWDGKEFDTEDEAYEDYLGNLYLYDDELIKEFMKNVSWIDFIGWATSQPSFNKEFGDEFDAAMRKTFEENYIEHDDDEDEFDPYIVGGGLTQRDFY